MPADQGGVPIPIEDYAYDGEGNRLASHLSGLYDTNPHNQLLSDDTYTYAYDARGNRISRTDRVTGNVEAYTYDSQNRLIGWTDGVSVISYAHDALDRRIAVTVDGVTDSFVHDPWSPYSTIANDVLLDFEDRALVRRWLHGPEVDEPLAYERYAGTTAGGSGTALELFRNRLGSVILAVSVSTGAVAAEYDYDSFGQRTLVQGTEEVRYGFTSREHDALTGLIHYRARAYDPLTGRFLQRDPIGFASGDLNLYAYVENDPYNWTDPSGLTTMGVAGPGGSIQRDSAIRGGLTPVFSGILGFAQRFANALRGYNNVTGAATAVMNQSGDGDDGDNTDSRGDDDGDQQPGSEPPEPVDIARELAAQCTAEPRRCHDFARELKDRLREAGVDFDEVYVRNTIRDYIYSERFGVISTSGAHEAVQVGDIIFDNNFPEGLPAGDWRFDIGEGFPGLEINVN
ncbi:RHS repeat-associated core domain-containing protein [Boseongicola sp. H5]|uniref:RHS repeat-associated core domain-containing protein n=1 Tax=Boseongicola sp. H5 TaxID=2763261 RepID=UPI001D0AC41F